MSKREFDNAVARVGGLSNPSKMPTLSYSTPAERCGLGSLLRKVEGSTCFDCYARKGCYSFRSTVDAMARRYEVIQGALESPIARAETIEAFCTLLADRLRRTEKTIARTGKPSADDGRYFRWHDSGDLISTDHLHMICTIAENSPRVTFWLPTRETGIVHAYLDAGGVIPPNLIVRLSVPMIDRIPEGKLLSAMKRAENVVASGVHTGELSHGESCSAYTREGNCADCRRCWETDAEFISYPKH